MYLFNLYLNNEMLNTIYGYLLILTLVYSDTIYSLINCLYIWFVSLNLFLGSSE